MVCATKRLQADRNGRSSADPFATEMWNPSVGKATESIHAIDTGSRDDPPTPGAWTDVAQPSPGESMRDAWVRESESYRLYVLEHYVPLNIDPVSFETTCGKRPPSSDMRSCLVSACGVWTPQRLARQPTRVTPHHASASDLLPRGMLVQ